MFGNIFNTSAVDQFADSIIAEVKRALPPGFSPGTKNIAERADKLNERITKQASDFVRTSPALNLYKKARLASRVREGMSAHGYPEPFVKSFSFDLIARLQAASKQRIG